ncbi:MAG TPA: bifunctional 3,4-dihydroxy-2-butanone-4-phosphate synthase/GTP cyclohydrolase II [Gammaproteobacteria bacterium]|nr:bifunctional 3,4-dihydroxy-2-butanone-4-phosphate synthase/GTP cyclohydrolase II [Gammaproteobacteria bacterium]
MALNSIEEIIADIGEGKMVILMDDEDRENEGDLIMAASLVRPQDVNFMARYGRGLICLTLTRERCRQLKLPLMVNDNNAKHSTNFTVSIEAAEGVTTGISAYDRAHTVRAAVAPDAGPDDIVQPGHIFPLMAQPGGVLTRAGHTEAGCDLTRLAGLEPAAVIVEILNEDGSMARRPDLEVFAAEHGLKMGTIADLIHYRINHEQTVERVAECDLPTEHGDFRLVAYQDTLEREVHLALVRGAIDRERPALVRVHMQNSLCDVLDARTGDCGWPLRNALARVAREGEGVVLLLRKNEDPRELVRKIRGYGLQEGSEPRRREPEGEEDLRTYGIGAQILADLGVRRMRVLSAPKRVHAIAGFGLEVVEYVPGD